MCAPPPDPAFACDTSAAWIPGVPGVYAQHHVLMAEHAAGRPMLRGCELMCVGARGPDGAEVRLWPGLVCFELAPAVEAQ